VSREDLWPSDSRSADEQALHGPQRHNSFNGFNGFNGSIGGNVASSEAPRTSSSARQVDPAASGEDVDAFLRYVDRFEASAAELTGIHSS